MNSRPKQPPPQPDYPHVEAAHWSRRRQLWMTFCVECRAPWPCIPYTQDVAVADAELRAYWRDHPSYGHAAALASV